MIRLPNAQRAGYYLANRAASDRNESRAQWEGVDAIAIAHRDWRECGERADDVLRRVTRARKNDG